VPVEHTVEVFAGYPETVCQRLLGDAAAGGKDAVLVEVEGDHLEVPFLRASYRARRPGIFHSPVRTR